MIRKFAALLLLVWCPLGMAEIGTIDKVPGATLLFPHFEVDTGNTQGNNTIITIQNTSATAIVGNVTLWTDQGIPTTNFVIYFTGYDQETIDLRRLFVDRLVPRTATDGQDPADTISPQGILSQDINFASCNQIEFLPDGQEGRFGPELIAAHTGQPAPAYFGSTSQCGSRNYGDRIARGYITVDTVNACTLSRPGRLGYFISGGAGIATLQNVMTGEYVLFDANNRRTVAESAVAIEASPDSPLTTGGAPTFYRGIAGAPSADNREPLPTAWAARFAGARTSFDFWREPSTGAGAGTAAAPYPCGGAGPGHGTQNAVTAYDASGTVLAQPTGDLFPGFAGTTAGSALGLNASLGWVFVNLNAGANFKQSWLNVRQVPASAAPGAPYGYATEAIQLGNLAVGPADPSSP